MSEGVSCERIRVGAHGVNTWPLEVPCARVCTCACLYVCACVCAMPEDMATQSEAHVAQMHTNASDPVCSNGSGEGGRGARAQAGPGCCAVPDASEKLCAKRSCACTHGAQWTWKQTARPAQVSAAAHKHSRSALRRSAPLSAALRRSSQPSTGRTRLPRVVARAGTRGTRFGRAYAHGSWTRSHSDLSPLLPHIRNPQCSARPPP